MSKLWHSSSSNTQLVIGMIACVSAVVKAPDPRNGWGYRVFIGSESEKAWEFFFNNESDAHADRQTLLDAIETSS